jgi:hypothetical protein
MRAALDKGAAFLFSGVPDMDAKLICARRFRR